MKKGKNSPRLPSAQWLDTRNRLQPAQCRPGRLIWQKCSLNASLGFTPATASNSRSSRAPRRSSGTFNGLPEGASLTIGNTPFTISLSWRGWQRCRADPGRSAAAPTVTGISPNSGPAAGGTRGDDHRHRLHRRHRSRLRHDGRRPASTWSTHTTITADSPAGTGSVNVTVMTPAARRPPRPPISSPTPRLRPRRRSRASARTAARRPAALW